MTNQEILDIKFESIDFDGKKVSIRFFLKELLKQVWLDDEGFNGKRPFGFSDWKDRIYQVLAAHDLVKADYNKKDAYYDKIDTKAADKIILKLIKSF